MLLLLVYLRYWWDMFCVVWVAYSYVCAWTLTTLYDGAQPSVNISTVNKVVQALYRLLLPCPWFLREECWNIQMLLWFLFICSVLLLFASDSLEVLFLCACILRIMVFLNEISLLRVWDVPLKKSSSISCLQVGFVRHQYKHSGFLRLMFTCCIFFLSFYF